MLPELTPIQTRYLEQYYLTSLAQAEKSFALATATGSKDHAQDYVTSITVANLLYGLGNFEKDPRQSGCRR